MAQVASSLFKPFVLSGVDAVAEAIASRDGNNLYRTSCFFKDVERYRSFCAQYAVMRVIDDRIDEIPSRTALTPMARAAELALVDAWRHAVRACHQREAEMGAEALERLQAHPESPDLLVALTNALHRFPVPLALWENFFDAMAFDIKYARFRTFEEFLTYSEGATVAPTTIYLYLLTAHERGDGRYVPPADFDLVGCGRELGVFAYLAHILRDLAIDLEASAEGLVYVADDDLARYGISELMLREDLAAGAARPALRSLVVDLAGRARQMAARGRRLLEPLAGKMTPDCAFILELIITIYEEVLNKIEATGFDPMAGQHNLSSSEKEQIVIQVAKRTGYAVF